MLSGNLTNAQPAWFVDAAAGDLHLTAAATPALDQTLRLADAGEDFDADLRPDTAVDLGADERGPPLRLFRDGFESP